MPGANFGWINETNPLGPPADSLNNTPLSAAELEAFRAAIETYNEGYTDGKISSDVTLANSALVPTAGAVKTYVANHSGSGSGSTGYVNAQDPSTTDGAAVLTGVTNGTNVAVPLQNMINAAANNATIYFPPGVYGITAPLVIPSNTHLVLAQNAVIRAIGSTTFQQLLVNLNSGASLGGGAATGNINITVDGGQWDGNGAQFVGTATSGSATITGVSILGASGTTADIPNGSFVQCPTISGIRVFPSNAVVTGKTSNTVTLSQPAATNATREFSANLASNKIMRFVGGSLVSQFCTNITVRNAIVHSSSNQGIGFNNCGNVMVVNNRVYNNGQDGIFLFGAEQNAVVNSNYCFNNGDDQIAIGETKRVTATGNLCVSGTGSGGSITVRGCETATITGNICYSSAGASIYLSSIWDTAGPLHDVLVSGNVVTNTGDGTGLASNIGGFSSEGIKIAMAPSNVDEVTNVAIIGNVVINSKGGGIVAQTDATGPTDGIRDLRIINNTVAWNDTVPAWTTAGVDGIGYDYTDAANIVDSQIIGNKVINPPGAGINVSGSHTKRVQILNNSVRRANGTSFSGINLDGASNAMVMGNVSYDNRGTGTPTQTYGISAQNNTGSLTLCHNDCTWVNANLTNEIHFVDPGGTLAILRLKDNPGFADVANKG